MRKPKDSPVSVPCPMCHSLSLVEVSIFGSPVKAKCWGCGHTGMYDDWLLIEDLRNRLDEESET